MTSNTDNQQTSLYQKLGMNSAQVDMRFCTCDDNNLPYINYCQKCKVWRRFVDTDPKVRVEKTREDTTIHKEIDYRLAVNIGHATVGNIITAMQEIHHFAILKNVVLVDDNGAELIFEIVIDERRDNR